MRKFITLALAWLCSWSLLAAPLDSLRVQLEEYTRALEKSSAGIKAEECDFLISACRDSTVRAFTAQTLFERYAASNVMNDEAVCVHLFDKWFADKSILFQSEEDYIAAKIFTDTHRNSLLGMQAPMLELRTADGSSLTIPEQGKLSLLFFYDSDCPVCKLYSKQLEVILSRNIVPLRCYAIYVGTEQEKWQNYRLEKEKNSSLGENLIHLWDPEGESRFAVQYGIVATPRLFLCDENGVIIGRALDPSALLQLLGKIKQDQNYSYGDVESTALFEQLLPAGKRSEKEVEEVISYFKWAAAERSDPALYRHLMGDLMYYLSRQYDEESIAACDALIQKHILSGEITWKGENDSLAIVHLANMLLDLHAKSAIGTPLPKVYAHVSECRNKGKGFEGKIRLDKLKKRCRFAKKEILLLFYDPACQDCKEQLEKARTHQDPQRSIFLVPVAENEKLLDTAEWEEWIENFDLTSLPYLILYDKEGKVSRRYFQL